VLSGEMAARIENQMLYTGLTYCGHPLSCAAGVAALCRLRDEKPHRTFANAGRASQGGTRPARDPSSVIGDVRGGHGLFAVVELVSDRAARTPLAPWPQTPPALKTLSTPRWPRASRSARAAT